MLLAKLQSGRTGEEKQANVTLTKRWKTALFASLKSKIQQSLYSPWGFQEAEAPRFHDNRHMKLVRLSALSTGRLCPPGNIRGWVDPRAIVQPKRLSKWKTKMTLSGIEPAHSADIPSCYLQETSVGLLWKPWNQPPPTRSVLPLRKSLPT